MKNWSDEAKALAVIFGATAFVWVMGFGMVAAMVLLYERTH